MGALREFIDDEELGRIAVRLNARARRFIFRADAGGLVVTCPPRSSEKEVRRAIDELRPRLQRLVRRHEQRLQNQLLTPETEWPTDLFRIVWRKGGVTRPTARHLVGKMEVVYSEGLSVEHPDVQKWLLAQVERNIALQAKHFLLPRLHDLAQQHGFHYENASIHRTHSRWGSCSTKGKINLSAYLVLLPAHLRDYVMLHELCHTREMNHSPRFWALLNSLAEGKSEAYRREMKKYDTSVFVLR